MQTKTTRWQQSKQAPNHHNTTTNKAHTQAPSTASTWSFPSAWCHSSRPIWGPSKASKMAAFFGDFRASHGILTHKSHSESPVEATMGGRNPATARLSIRGFFRRPSNGGRKYPTTFSQNEFKLARIYDIRFDSKSTPVYSICSISKIFTKVSNLPRILSILGWKFHKKKQVLKRPPNCLNKEKLEDEVVWLEDMRR